MPSSKYHREQAKVLAGLALSTHDATEADRFNLAAMQHLEQAQAVDGAAGDLPTRPDLASTTGRFAPHGRAQSYALRSVNRIRVSSSFIKSSA